MTQPNKPAALRLTRLVMMKECPWLYRDYERDEIVFPYSGPTYGVISPDGRACSDLPGREPFFELPAAALELHHDQ